MVLQVARLLLDTSVSHFYGTVFVLATDVMDMLGDMVWERIKQKVEFSEDRTKMCSLPGLSFDSLISSAAFLFKSVDHWMERNHNWF